MVELHSSHNMDASNDPAVPPVFLTRREMRAAEARTAAEKTAFSRSAKAVAVPAVPTPASPVLSSPIVASVPTAAAIAAAKAKKARKNPIGTLATMVVVGGMFVVAGLPAYAFTTPDETTDTVAANAGEQTMDISAGATQILAIRDGYSATTPEELAALAEEARVAQIQATITSTYSSGTNGVGTYSAEASVASGARALGDDYPWPNGGPGGSYGLSPLAYYYGECVDFVAWRLNRDAGSTSAPWKYTWSNLTPNGGNASQWKNAWDNKGWTVSQTPIPGSVAWFPGNHVAYVKEVLEGGFVVIEEYNYIPKTYGQRTLAIGDVAAFLYPPG